MSKDFVKEKVVFLSKDHVDGLKPYLKVIKEGSSRKEYRVAAASLLHKMEGIGDKGFKQVLLSKREENLLSLVHEAFPYEAVVPKQLKLM